MPACLLASLQPHMHVAHNLVQCSAREAELYTQAGLQAGAQVVAQIERSHADHFYAKHDFDSAIQHYIATIGQLEPSYVIRKFLDAQRIHHLTSYLEELHSQVPPICDLQGLRIGQGHVLTLTCRHKSSLQPGSLILDRPVLQADCSIAQVPALRC